MTDDVLGPSLHAGALLACAGVLAWLTGRPMVFPSLGPTAYLLATGEPGSGLSARRVLGGHAVGVLAGLAAYHGLAAGFVVTAGATALSGGLLRLAAAGVVSVALTTAGMRATGTVHPPACATTLIVSLGLLSSPGEGGLILLAVGVVFAVHVAAGRVAGRPGGPPGSRS